MAYLKVQRVRLSSFVKSRGQDQRFLQPHSRIDSYLYSYYRAYYPSTIKLWNNLSSSTVYLKHI